MIKKYKTKQKHTFHCRFGKILQITADGMAHRRENKNKPHITKHITL